MKPYSSSSERENCSPVSSNCVEWQGPFIQCINNCKGDSVSDIVYKLSEKVCNIADGTTINDINLTCILNACDTLQAPDGTLGSLLQTIVDGVCCSVTSLNQQTENLTARTSNLYNEPSLILPVNFQYTDPSTGLPVARLPLSDFAENTATNTSVLKTTVARHTVQINNQEVRVQSLETNPGYVPPTVTPLCTYGGVVSGLPTEMNILLQALENDYCLYKLSVGGTTDVVNATNAQCAFLGSQSALGQTGIMSTISGWNNNINSLSQSMQNLWITVCDMRTAVNLIRQSILPDCAKFLLGFTSVANSGRTTITLIFNGLTVIPVGFSNCPTLSTVSITDGLNTYTDTLNLTTYATDPEGIIYTVDGAGLNPDLPWTITVNGCLISGETTCSKTITNSNVPATTTTTPAPNSNYIITITQEDIDKATGNTDPNQNDVVFASYFSNTGAPVVTAFDIAIGSSVCVLAGTIPMVYYYATNSIQTGSSAAVYISPC